jgi:hypothetical protein
MFVGYILSMPSSGYSFDGMTNRLIKRTKYIKLLSGVMLLSLVLGACSNNGTAPGNKEAVSSPGDAHFSCVIDGQSVSGGLIDDGFQQANGYQSNAAYIDDVDEGKELLFYLSDSKSTGSRGIHSLRFSVPDKMGNESFGHEENGWGIEVDILVNKQHTARYNSDSFTINITTLSATRVSGTFSGKFSLHGNIDDTDKKEIEVTDGKFEIPISTRK